MEEAVAKVPPRKITLAQDESDALHVLDQARKDAALMWEAAQKAFHGKIADLLKARGITEAELTKQKITLDLNITPAAFTLEPK